MHARLAIEDQADAARALGIGAALLAEVGSGDVPVGGYGAGLTGAATSAGAFQRTARGGGGTPDGALAAEVRRATGGPATYAGDGIVYFALALPSASALMDTPRDRVLNRNVRGILAGLSSAGVPAHYFGREWVSVARRPAGLVAWTRSASGAVLLETFLGNTKPFDGVGTAPSVRSVSPVPGRFLGKEPIALAEAWGRVESARRILERVAEGYAARFAVEWEAGAAPAPRLVAEPEWEEGLRWSPAVPVAIGAIECGVRLAGDRIEAAALAGDFFADAGGPAALARALRGAPPTAAAVGAAVDATFGRTGTHVIEGLADLAAIRDALLAAAT